ncbi:MAG: chitobiase/beta-hexosaminidase C-terminal domain-containing protein, partial [Planctomycetes bacterium]|nr:chitobiase/beta-hexosaminidase C-terminal domain-containing protein [Planctomycetota bacterium]
MKCPRIEKVMALVVLSAVVLGGSVAEGCVIWVAYNDCIRDPADNTHENATDWTIYDGYTTHNTGKLKEIATGSEEGMPTVRFTMNSVAPVRTRVDYGDNFDPGTAAHAVFDGKVDFGGTIIQHSSDTGWWVEIEFTGLDPTKKYTFVGSAVRIWGTGINNRRSLFTIRDAIGYTNNSGYHGAVGDPNWVGTDTTKFLAVDNDTFGVLVRWDDIDPGPDEDFTIRAEADSSPGSHGRQGYPFGGFMLEQTGEVGNQAPVVGAGSDCETRLPDNTVNLNGTVRDDGLGEPNGFLEFEWSKVSGPGEVTFVPNASVENPTVIFEPLQDGSYVLRLEATDGELWACDDVTITVHESICPTGDLSGDCIVNSADVAILADQWLSNPGGSADLDGDNDVEMGDFAWLAMSWGENRQSGSVHVSIEPEGAVDAGAQWRVDGGTWREAGDTQGDLSVGWHTVEFSAVAGWDKPGDEPVQVSYAETANEVGTYIQQKGLLRVTISPQAAIDAGAQWRVDGGTWRDNDDPPFVLPVGLHTIEYKMVSGWIKPGSQEVRIDKNLTTVTGGVYKELGETPVVISEFMAVNSHVPSISSLNIYTEVYGFDVHPDWIELHNLDLVNTIDLEGWYLTNSAENLTKWRFPSGVSIGANGYYVLFASGKTREDNPTNYPFVDDDGALHTNFALGAGGDYLALVKPDGVTVVHEYAPEYPDQQGFVSYGISSGGENGYLLTPTPGIRVGDKWRGAANSAKYDGAVADTKFSRDRGFYDTAFSVTITCETPGATVRYTTDGSEPTLSHGSTANGPIPISTTTCLRATAFKTGWLPSNVDTQTYIFPAHVVVQSQADAAAMGYPTSSTAWSGYPGDYEMDPQVYNDPDYRDDMVGALLSIPTLSVATDRDNLFGSSIGIYTHPTQKGISWERAVSAELFDVDGRKEFQVSCGLRIQGGASRNARKAPKHSLSLRFRGGYGPGELEYDLFDGSRVDRFNSLQLRAMYNNSWIHWDSGQRRRGSMIRDQWMRDSLLDMGEPGGGYGTYVHLYLNGFYWGAYNVHERPDAEHYASHYGGDDDQLDALNAGSAVDGSTSSWNSLQNLIANAVTGGISLAEYDQIKQKLDVVNLADYMIINHYGANKDWDDHNWRAAGGGLDDMPWRIFSWDAERVLEKVDASKTGQNSSGDPSRLFNNLLNSAEFKMLLADRAHKHLFNDGALTAQETAARWMKRAAELDLAIICESARWGDYRRDVHSYSNDPYYLYTKNGHWLPEQNRLINDYFPKRTNSMFNSNDIVDQYKNRGWYPSVAAPAFSPHGGWDLNGFTLTMTKPAAVYYTLDGADPRLPGGAVNTDHAKTYSTAINLTATTHVKARAKSGSTWSALNEAVFAVGPVAESLRITEIMYHPKDTGDPDDPNEEFVELKNISGQTININLVKFTNGIGFTFPDIDLPGGGLVVLVRNQAAFAAQYPGFSGVIAGEYTGSLDNGGEKIELTDAVGWTIQDFKYGDDWRPITDGEGFSLTIIDPANA